MKKVLLVLTLAFFSLYALDSFEPSKTCKTCHPIIYKEHFGSAHKNATIFKDPIHKAIWEKHPAKKKGQYKCAKCHTPTDTKLLNALANNETALPQKSSKAQQEAISCVYCHSIKDVEYHAKANTNILTDANRTMFSARKGEKDTHDKEYTIESSLFGLLSKKTGSPFHKIDFSNENFYNGKICTGCHSHKQNSHNFDICNMDLKENTNTEDENCITCHMPMVQGSFTTAKDSKTHRYHGFTGAMHKPQMLAKYVKIYLNKSDDGFVVRIKNTANHQLLLHPLRVGELRVHIQRDGKTIKLPSVKFMRIIGKDSKPAMPWVADSVLKNTHIQANENRLINFNEHLQDNDRVIVELGHYIVNPKIAKKLGLEDYKEYTKFTLFKKSNFLIR